VIICQVQESVLYTTHYTPLDNVLLIFKKIRHICISITHETWVVVGRIRQVHIPLLSQCTHETVSTVLRVSNLPLDYISQLKPSERPPPWPSTVTTCHYPSARSVYEAYRVPGAETFRSSWKKRVSYDTLK